AGRAHGHITARRDGRGAADERLVVAGELGERARAGDARESTDADDGGVRVGAAIARGGDGDAGRGGHVAVEPRAYVALQRRDPPHEREGPNAAERARERLGRDRVLETLELRLDRDEAT